MKKIVSTVLFVAMLTLTAYAYTPASSNEVDDSADVFSYVDDISNAEEQSYTEIGREINGTNWRMRNATETPDGLTEHKADTPAKFGINSEGDLFVDAVFNSVQVYNSQVSKTIPALVLSEDLSDLTEDHQITFDVKKVHNATVTTGVRFMVHNDGKNYYALIFGGNNYNNGSALAGWQLLKCTDNTVVTLKEGGNTNYPAFNVMRNTVGNFWNVSITVSGKKISFVATQDGNSANSFEYTYIDEDKFNVSGNDAGVWLMAMNGNSNPARNAVYKNFTIKSYVPYLTAPEPDEIIYYDAAEGKVKDDNGIINLESQMPIRKIIAPSINNGITNIYFSNDKTQWDKITDAEFDENGVWINNKTDRKYSYLAFGSDIAGDVSVLTEIPQNEILEFPLKTTIHLYPKSGDVSDASAFNWTSNREDIATINNGEVNFLRKGDVLITSDFEDTSFACNITVIGEIENAIKNNTVAEYLDGVKPVFDEINRGITGNDSDILNAVFKNTGDIKIENIVDIDAQKVMDLEKDEFDSFISRIMTYDSFPCEKIENVYYLANTIDVEYAVGLLNDLSDSAEVISTLEQQNHNYKLNLDNKYYKKYADATAKKLCLEKFTNITDLKSKFEQAYVMAALKNALSPDMVEDLVEDCEIEIAYNKQHYDDVKSTDLFETIISNKENITDINKLMDAINKFKKPDDNDDSGSKSSSNGGSGTISLDMKVDNATVDKINAETQVTLKPIVKFADLGVGHWAYNSVMVLNSMNIISGYEDGYFRPENVVTRAEFIKMLALALKLELKDSEITFSDVTNNDWYYDAVMLGAQSGIITGYPNGSFCPNEIVTREEMATMLYRAYQERLGKNSIDDEEVELNDWEDISNWAQDAVESLFRAGVLSKNDNSMFEPSRGATRAETAKCISALLR